MSEVTGGTSGVLNEASTVFEIEIDIPTNKKNKQIFFRMVRKIHCSLTG
jgi:hypothetical protein